MSGRFSYSTPGRHSGTPWFRAGDVDVTTSVLVAAGCVLSMFGWAISPSALAPLVLFSDDVRHGQIWRLVTWPLANAPSIWTLISIAIFWYFGSQLEAMLGRNRFVWFLAILTITPALVGVLFGLNVAGLEYLELGIFLVFIAEYPFARFFFGIPGWVVGAVIVGLQFLQLLGNRDQAGLAFLAMLIVTAGVAARSFGLATSLPWIPKLPLPGSGVTTGSRSPVRRKPAASSPRASRKVVEGPWAAPTTPTPGSDAVAAQAELDLLLDKISAGGLDSLTADEKRRLNELSKKLR